MKGCQQQAIRAGWQAAFTVGLFIACIPLMSALTFYIGSRYINNSVINSNSGKPYTAGDVLTVFFSILLSGLNLGQAIPMAKCFAEGAEAGRQIFAVIDSKK